MTAYLYDTETNGLLPEVSTMHSLVLKDIDTGKVWSFADQPGYYPIKDGLYLLSDADMIIGHNVIKYDQPVIKKLYPGWTTRAVVRDTLLLSRLIWPEVKASDFANVKKPGNTFPKNLIGRYSLEAWGYRLKLRKGDFGKGQDWKTWSKEMQDYCEQDIAVTAELWKRISAKNYSERAIELEHRFQEIIFNQEMHGVYFDVDAARHLSSLLAARRQEIEEEMQKVFRPWFAAGEVVTPKKTLNYKDAMRPSVVAEAPYTRVKETTFNPGSRDHISNRLKAINGWEPTEFTGEGKPKVDETILETLPWPEAKVITEFLMLQKRLGQISEGDKAWLKLEKNGKIHGRVETVGAVTRRCTHNNPNITQVTSVKLEKVDGKEVPMMGARGGFGYECRACFIAPPGYKMVGADAAGLELRMLAHYMARYDGGAYAKVVVEGDVHTVNKEAAGLFNRGSPGAKTFIYAYLYGAGDEKLGTIVVEDALLAGKDPFADIDHLRTSQGARWNGARQMILKQGRTPTDELIAIIVKGGLLKKRFLAKMPALKALREAIDHMVKQKGTLRAVDGGLMNVRHKHAALNTLLQSGGAIVVKLATNLFWEELSTRGLHDRENPLDEKSNRVFQALHAHDELQVYAREDIADEVGQIAVASIKKAGEEFNLRCPLDGAYKVGPNWATTH